ncbi:helix-turn-helix domain-containing protein [Natronorubrum thiooxidans]|uniref:Sugar-specific transcriptional regulator TrmB n=1 Tax=Natronorubrum thiooxidans TaxID=308853 RepID=A0A1N7E2G8_9EURY|nr:helix-turn-helix domain-containing protein [Natronorubrum thiooxidans]SIR82273.1 Sugar-specific transcriptional regulator TrmB [Natronorubrum thiooxidans]
MATDDTDEHQVDDGNGDPPRDDSDDALERTESEFFEAESDGVRTTAVEEVDQRIVDLLSWILDTETRAKIYVHLLAHPGSTSEEVAKGTGLYPSTVREALAELHDEDRVTREKRASEGAGNNPYEYTAIQPSELVGGVVDQVQRELNTIFTLDRHAESTPDLEDGTEPITITVNETSPIDPDAGDDDDPETDDSR